MGGSGAVILEASAVRPDGRIATGDLGIYKDEHIDGLQRIAAFLKENGAVAGIQLAHAGRKGSTWASGGDSKILKEEEGGWELIAPSPIPFTARHPTPREMSSDDIRSIRSAFKAAAGRALKAGFQLIEIHSAHGYLLHEFLSPISNKRRDAYGGTIENRSRLLLEVLADVREVWPESLPISVRISGTEWTDEGWTIDDSVWLTEKLADAGVDLIDVSSGGNVADASIPVGAGYQVPLASKIKQKLGEKICIGTVGLINSAEQAETILVNGDADFVILGRALLKNPYFPLHAADVLHSAPQVPKQYERAF